MDVGQILEAIWEGICTRWVFFCTLKSIVIWELISELPRGAPGSPRDLGNHTSELAKSWPAPKGKDSRDLESPDPGPGPDPRGLAGQVQVLGRCRAGAGARHVQGRC